MIVLLTMFSLTFIGYVMSMVAVFSMVEFHQSSSILSFSSIIDLLFFFFIGLCVVATLKKE